MLLADADFAGDKNTSKSTSGGVLVLVGPRTWAPLGAICKAQGAVSHSTTEAEVISFEVGLRTEGLPVLIFWDFVYPYISSGGPEPKKNNLAFTTRGEVHRKNEEKTRSMFMPVQIGSRFTKI